MAKRQSVLGPDSQWRESSGGGTALRAGLRPSVLGPDGDWREVPLAWWTRRRVTGALLGVVVLAAAVLGWRAVDGYAPLSPGPTFGLEGDLRQVAAGEDGVPEGVYAYSDANVPYRDGELTTWTYSLRNSGHIDVEILSLDQPSLFLVDVVEVTVTHRRNPSASLPLTLAPGESLRVDLTLRSVRCELSDDGTFYGWSGVVVRQRAWALTRDRRVAFPQSLVVGRDVPGSGTCPRPTQLPLPEAPAEPGIVPPY